MSIEEVESGYGAASLDIWEEPLAVGQPLPTLPLRLPGHHPVPVDLEASYERTCREQRLPIGESA
jgi:hypothetical protein